MIVGATQSGQNLRVPRFCSMAVGTVQTVLPPDAGAPPAVGSAAGSAPPAVRRRTITPITRSLRHAPTPTSVVSGRAIPRTGEVRHRRLQIALHHVRHGNEVARGGAVSVHHAWRNSAEERTTRPGSSALGCCWTQCAPGRRWRSSPPRARRSYPTPKPSGSAPQRLCLRATCGRPARTSSARWRTHPAGSTSGSLPSTVPSV
jgi:hypothetical protein